MRRLLFLLFIFCISASAQSQAKITIRGLPVQQTPPAIGQIFVVDSGSKTRQVDASLVGLSGIPDYNIYIVGSNIVGIPRVGTGLSLLIGTDAYTIIQTAITALTQTGGGTGSAGGLIVITEGLYSLSNELTITGWENTINPYSQLTIKGSGWGTILFQNTAGKNAFVVKNNAGVTIRDLNITTGSGAKSAILGDDNGATWEASFNRGQIDNVFIQSNSTGYPGVLLKNFFNLSIGFLQVVASNDAIVLDNTSAGTSYGNSNWKAVYANAGDGFAGLRTLTHNSGGGQGIGMMSMSHYESHSGKYGIYTAGISFSTFSFIDIEATTNGVYIGDGSRGNKVLGGYILNVGGDTAIFTSGSSGGNDIHVEIEGSSTTKVVDQQQFILPNSFDLTLGLNIPPSNIILSNPKQTPLIYRQINGSSTGGYIPASILQNQSYTAKTANYTIGNGDYLVNCTANSFTVTLPTAVGIQGRVYVVKNRGVGTITLATTSSQTIDGSAPGTITAGSVAQLMSDNTNWIKIN